MDVTQAKALFEKYRAGKATDEEKALLESWYLELARSRENDLTAADLERAVEEIWASLPVHEHEAPVHRVQLWPRIVAAASILLFLSFGGYFLLHRQQARHTAQNQVHDIAPGGNKAILTLSNGQKIVLNGKQGKIAVQAGRQVLVGANGGISYAGQSNSNGPIYNTLTVPIGNRRDLVLPDGSQVSLDAGSSITYPVVFATERKVTMTGQAYFIVKHDPAHPFFTTVKGVVIQDIGTEFNINAYDEEPAIKTTLIQGSVKVNDLTLIPGQQAQIRDNHTAIKIPDMEAVTAWKNNDFYFSNESLKSGMRQIARWYNVNIVYNNVDERLKIFVDVTRSTNLSVVLKAIENTGKVKCSLEGHTITLSQAN